MLWILAVARHDTASFPGLLTPQVQRSLRYAGYLGDLGNRVVLRCAHQPQRVFFFLLRVFRHRQFHRPRDGLGLQITGGDNYFDPGERRQLTTPNKPSEFVQPDFGRMHQELRRKGMTLKLMWEEYKAAYAGKHTYGYSQYWENYRRFVKRLKRSMRQIHRAGEKLFIDYAGPTVGPDDGSPPHIFVTALGASSYTFACATPRETMADWLDATVAALGFIGGVTQLIVPDNSRALICDANRYEPRANDTVLDFARPPKLRQRPFLSR
jgi:hypothetical protein